jgi:glycosyltransferase, group 1 family
MMTKRTTASFKKLMKRGVKAGLRTLGVDPRHITRMLCRLRGRTIACNVNKTNYEKNCLLQYVAESFYLSPAERNTHQSQWQVMALAAEIGRFCYNVDVRDVDECRGLDKNYDLVIDLHPGFNDTYKSYMKKNCRSIAYITGMNPSVANFNEQLRLDAVYERKGVRLPPERQVQLISREIELFNGVFFIGNAYNLNSFNEFLMPPTFFIKNTGYSFPISIDGKKRSPRKFLFFASNGQVHKGLDLLLEIFGQDGFPYELYICSGFREEPAFCKLYNRELFHTRNIRAIGFVDIMGDEFREIAQMCAFSVLPSCSEGIAGSVLTTMSAGLIPIVSKECGFEDDEVIHLQDCEMDTIEQAIRHYGERDIDWIRAESARVQAIVQERYSEEAFIRSVRQGLESVLA